MSQASILPPLTQIPPYLQTVADYERQAQLHLSDMVWQYLQGGAMDEVSVRSNLSAFDHIQLMPRLLQDLTHGHTECEIFGQRYPHPIFVAPIAFLCPRSSKSIFPKLICWRWNSTLRAQPYPRRWPSLLLPGKGSSRI